MNLHGSDGDKETGAVPPYDLVCRPLNGVHCVLIGIFLFIPWDFCSFVFYIWHQNIVYPNLD